MAWRRHAAVTAALMAVCYGLVYFPYARSSIPGRLLSSYLAGLAHAAGALLHFIDGSVRVDGTRILGRVPLDIVLDCAALDTQALYVAAVASFPTRRRLRVAGALAGIAAINLANLLRIVGLYFVGLLWPAWFHFIHEEVLQFAMVAVACGAFAVWLLWARARQRREAIGRGP